MKHSGFRIDVQALRALAVVCVVIFHLWPEFLPGGYVGVDVFFVISGYLITSHLIAEYSKSGKISFLDFYIRRIKRLMPLALTVLLVVGVSAILFMPWRTWERTSQQLISSSLGFQNWLLASQSVDYFAATSQPSPVQHYWSLSLEEQFYLFWPLLIVAALYIGNRFRKSQKFTTIPLICLVFGASLLFSIIETSIEPTVAYFSTFTHVWEFAIGGLAAVLFNNKSRLNQRQARAMNISLSLSGFALILISAYLFSGITEFPGYMALLPVSGVVLVLISAKGNDTFRGFPRAVNTPLLWTGSNSYAIYLWHWPPIVILPAILGHSLGNTSKVFILVSTFVVAALTTRYIEMPFRNLSSTKPRPFLILTIAAMSTASVIVIAAVLNSAFVGRLSQAKQNIAEALDKSVYSESSCFGAAAMDLGNVCPLSHQVSADFDVNFASEDWGDLPGQSRDRYMFQTQLCEDFASNKEPLFRCTLGSVGSLQKIAVVGDSHAFALLEPLVLLANSKGYEVDVFLHDSCSPQFVSKIDSNSSSCDLWRNEVANFIETTDDFSTVIVTGFSRRGTWVPFEGSKTKEVSRYQQLYEKWELAGKEVYVISDVPLTGGQKVPECVSLAVGVVDPCSLDRETALGWDPTIFAVKKLNSPNVHLVDLTNAFCDESKCHAVVGGLIAYRDEHHISGSFAKSLLPNLEKQISLK